MRVSYNRKPWSSASCSAGRISRVAVTRRKRTKPIESLSLGQVLVFLLHDCLRGKTEQSSRDVERQSGQLGRGAKKNSAVKPQVDMADVIKIVGQLGAHAGEVG